MHSSRCIHRFGPCLFTTCVVGPVKKIAIPITALNQTAMLVANALHRDSFTVLVALDIERAAGPDSDTSDVYPGF